MKKLSLALLLSFSIISLNSFSFHGPTLMEEEEMMVMPEGELDIIEEDIYL